jgi:two-component system, chemotaxis family, chemotaxis protein CheV
VDYITVNNGRQAWQELNKTAAPGRKSNFIQILLTDVEMPEMDDYATRDIRSDPRLAGISVLMRSLLPPRPIA